MIDRLKKHQGMARCGWLALGLFCLLLCTCLMLASCHTESPSAEDTQDLTDAPETEVSSDFAMTEESLDSETAAEPTETDGLSETEPPETSGDSEQDAEVITLGAPETMPTPDLEIDASEVEKQEMPRIDITTEGGQAIQSKDYYVNATVSVSRCDEQYVLESCAAGVRVRGNSTAAAPKKPYRIKFETKQSMLGLNDGEAFKSWCLMADYYDGSMLRTWATFHFAEVLLGGKYYSSDCTPVEVYVNGQYMGVYLLCEQTQIDNDRINIYEAEDGDPSLEIGYLLVGQGGRTDEPETVVVYPEITVYDRNGDSMYFGGMNFALSGSGYTEEQKAYVSKYVSAVFKVVASALYENKYYTLDREGNMRVKTRFQGKTAEERQIETINAVFNIESAVRMCILDEIAKNLDAMTFNMYVDLSPTGDGRLTLAAPWDFDFAMANTHYSSTHGTSGFYATNLSYSEGMRTNLWYVMLGSIDWFEAMVKEVWQANYHRLQTVAMETLTLTYRYADAYGRDWETWGAPANRQLIHHHCQADLVTFQTHADNGIFLNSWLMGRLRWLNRQWGDGSEVVPQSPLLIVDLTNPDNMSYVNGFRRCEGSITDRGLRVVSTDGYDPHFYVDFTTLPETFIAEEYPYVEIEYMIPSTNQHASYACELFLCAGNVQEASPGVSVGAELGVADGQYRTLRIHLGESGYWDGDIHKIRIDFFNSCGAGDEIFIRSVSLKTQ